MPPAPVATAEVHFWGDWASTTRCNHAVAYTDGSGYDAEWPELCRGGWAVVQMGPDNRPVRAIYGVLSGPRQTVGHAERTTMLMGLRHLPWLSHIVSELESLVNEGNAWGDSLASSPNQYADIWRAAFAAGGP
eukprot:7548653-Pyramimonas_sp.AAC.1